MPSTEYRNAGDNLKPILSLLTDFGLADPFVAEMKAIILSICPDARIIDISHQVEKFDIRMGAFLLADAAPYFPPGTVHVAVVDPGVGSARLPIVIETSRGLYVGPDNGLLIPAAQSENILRVHKITNQAMMRDEISTTFHGRDIFAPVAAHLASGRSPKDCGPEITDFVKAPYPQPIFEGGIVRGEVIYIDSFGNIVTNLSDSHISKINLEFDRKIPFSLDRKRVRVRVVRTYSDLAPNEVGVLVGSHGFLEIACREKSAARRFRARRASAVRLYGVQGGR